jgi:hypothetical protein
MSATTVAKDLSPKGPGGLSAVDWIIDVAADVTSQA